MRHESRRLRGCLQPTPRPEDEPGRWSGGGWADLLNCRHLLDTLTVLTHRFAECTGSDRTGDRFRGCLPA